jgi:hypothetical protein
VGQVAEEIETSFVGPLEIVQEYGERSFAGNACQEGGALTK